MPAPTPSPPARDLRLLFATRMARMFAYGLISIVLVLFLDRTGLADRQIGVLLTLTLLGDTALSLWLTTRADRHGRRRTLLAGAALMLAAGAVFALAHGFWLLLLAATVGVISPSGKEVGPFLAIEQAALAEVTAPARRTHVFAWYNLAGSLAAALGALVAGGGAQVLQDRGWPVLASYRLVLAAYAGLGGVLAALFLGLSPAVEVAPAARITGGSWLGLHRSRRVVLELSALFSLDAFAGGFIMESLVAWWFHLRFGVSAGVLGAVFFGSNLLAALSSLLAARLAARFGLLNTMVFTHVPSNLLLVLVPLMPSFALAVAVLLLRYSISQMDVPTRQSYTMAVVARDERSAAAGVTGIARTTGAALAPLLATPLMGAAALASLPFFVAGGLKIVYDLLLFRRFRRLPPGDAGS